MFPLTFPTVILIGKYGLNMLQIRKEEGRDRVSTVNSCFSGSRDRNRLIDKFKKKTGDCMLYLKGTINLKTHVRENKFYVKYLIFEF